MNRYLAGAIGGVLATVPMTLMMSALFRRLPDNEQYPLPPREITDEVLRRANQQQRFSEPQQVALSLGAHFVYGGLTGAFYPVLIGSEAHSVGIRRNLGYPLLFGGTYGVAVWAGSYLGWIPALRLLGPATVQPAPRRRLMICVHLVWGAGTVLIGERLGKQSLKIIIAPSPP